LPLPLQQSFSKFASVFVFSSLPADSIPEPVFLLIHQSSTELDTDHYLLCAKVDFPPQWPNKNINKKFPSNQEEFFKIRLLNDKSIRRLFTQRAQFHLNSLKENETDTEKERENLQNILKSAAYES
jgi:hypothetical protein